MNRRSVNGWLSLAGMAIGAGLLWRLEIERHGWAGLTWISYDHWAVPIGVALFILWAVHFSGIAPVARRLKFVLVLSGSGVVLGTLAGAALWNYFVVGPMALFSTPLFGRLVYVLYPGIPLVLWVIGWGFGMRISIVRGLASLFVFLSSYPIALLALRLIRPGEADAIHTIKTGYIVPLLVVGLGILFLPPTPEGPGQDIRLNRTAPPLGQRGAGAP